MRKKKRTEKTQIALLGHAPGFSARENACQVPKNMHAAGLKKQSKYVTSKFVAFIKTSKSIHKALKLNPLPFLLTLIPLPPELISKFSDGGKWFEFE